MQENKQCRGLEACVALKRGRVARARVAAVMGLISGLGCGSGLNSGSVMCFGSWLGVKVVLELMGYCRCSLKTWGCCF